MAQAQPVKEEDVKSDFNIQGICYIMDIKLRLNPSHKISR